MPSNYIHDRYLDSEERYEVRTVKAAERPHLLNWEEETTEEDEVVDEKKNDDESSDFVVHPPPLTDGCDIPGWRSRRLAPCLTAEKTQDSIGLVLGGTLNVGSGATLFRRDSQFPFICNNSNRNRNGWWYNMKKRLYTPPPQDRDAPIIDYISSCALVDFIDESNRMNKERRVTLFSMEYEQKNRPVKILGATVDWPAMPNYNEASYTSNEPNNQGWAEINESSELFTANGTRGWTFGNLVSRFGNVLWRFSDQHGEMMSLQTYSKYITTPEGLSDDSPLGIYDSQFGDDDPTKVLLNEYTVPKCFSQDLFELMDTSVDSDVGEEAVPRPPHRWILIGPERSGTGLHVDPLCTCAWVTVLQGQKRWLLFPPETPYELIGMIEGEPQIPSSIWFADYYERVTSPSWPENYKPVEILQRPGETVFVPAGWPHLVLNLELTVAVTHNYASEFGPYNRMVEDVLSEEPEFAVKWRAGLKKNGREDLISW